MRKLLTNKVIVLIILSSLGMSCRKDSPIPEPPINNTDTLTIVCNTCPDFPPPGELGYGYVQSGIQYFKPCFNPNNENEFIYIRKTIPTLTELVKYDLVTNSETILCDTEYIISQPQWGKLGIITFNTLNWKVWIINEDGSNLIQLTFEERDIFPNFNFTGDAIYYYRGKPYSNYEHEQNPNLIFESLMMKIDLNGNFIDSITTYNIFLNTFYQNWGVSDFNNSTIYFKAGTAYNHGIYKMDENIQTISPVFSWYEELNLLDLDFSNNKIYYTFWHNNLNIFDINTNTNNVFLEGCDTKYYDKISISPNGNEMLVEKIINIPTVYEYGTVDIDEKHEIWLINLNDKTETRILGE